MANHYIRQGATGSADGTDWTNAWTTLGAATYTRGDTYYIADGSYAGTTFSTAVSGTTLITIKKATIADHGTETGWDNTYGDGQATFTSTITVTTDDWVFDGQARNDSDWSQSSAYGFFMDIDESPNSTDVMFNISSTDNLTFRYFWMQYTNVKGGADIADNRKRGMTMTSCTNITFEYSAMRAVNQHSGFVWNGGNTFLIQYSWFELINRKQLVSSGASGSGSDNLTFRYNMSKNVAGTGWLSADSTDGWEIYGNWLWNPDAAYDFTDVILGNWTGDHPSRNEINDNMLVYNNTFYDHDSGATIIDNQSGTGNECRNNLFIGFTSSIGGFTTSNNDQNAATSTVTDADNGDFTLSGATSAGNTLSSPYDTDLTGATRGADGTWDRGAYEFQAGGGTPTRIAIRLP